MSEKTTNKSNNATHDASVSEKVSRFSKIRERKDLILGGTGLVLVGIGVAALIRHRNSFTEQPLEETPES